MEFPYLSSFHPQRGTLTYALIIQVSLVFLAGAIVHIRDKESFGLESFFDLGGGASHLCHVPVLRRKNVSSGKS